MKLRLPPPLPAPPDHAERPLGVRVVVGADMGKAATFVDGVLRIGRREGNHLRLSDPKVSKRHSELRMTPYGVELWDLGSRHGTWCRDIRIKAVLLDPIRLFRVADTQLELVHLSEGALVG